MVKSVVCTVLFCSLLWAAQDDAENVALSGVVKDNTGSALEGVTVSLAIKKELSATTDAGGLFSLTSETGVVSRVSKNMPVQFSLCGNTIHFFPTSEKINGEVALFSGDGRRCALLSLDKLYGRAQHVTIPEVSSGVYVLKVVLGDQAFTRSLICTGSEFHLQTEPLSASSTAPARHEKRSTAAAVEDTLIAVKDGFVASRVPVTEYVKSDIEITLAAEGSGSTECTRELLQTIADGFIEALKTGDTEKMNLADDAVYLENMESSSFDEGVWENGLDVGFHMEFFDVDSCMIFAEVMDYESSDPHEVGVQITVKDGKIVKIDALVSSVGDWALEKASAFTFRYDIASREDWGEIPVSDRDARDVIQYAGDSYLDLFDTENTGVKNSDVPWGKPCGRLEGEMYTGNKDNLDDPDQTCNTGVPDGVPINSRTYVVDVDKGVVSILCKFGGSMPDSHLFRVENGKLRYVHTISIN